MQYEQKANILAEILASVVHLHTHCDEDLQKVLAQPLQRRIADELDSLLE